MDPVRFVIVTLDCRLNFNFSPNFSKWRFGKKLHESSFSY